MTTTDSTACMLTPTTTADRGTDSIDGAAMLKRFDGDAALLREVAELFLEDCPKRRAALRDALACYDSKALELVAHSIRGSAGIFGATAAADGALKVELMARAGDLASVADAVADMEVEVTRLLLVLRQLVPDPSSLETKNGEAGAREAR